MRAFAELLDRLSLTPSRNAKLVLVRDYLRAAPDPDRGWALAALTGKLAFVNAKSAMIRKAVEARVDPVLFGWSYDYVGDLAETVSLIWPPPADYRPNREPEIFQTGDWQDKATGENLSLRTQAIAILNALDAESTPPVTLDDGAKAAQIALAIRASIDEERIVEL